ncbi:hypothetical protein BpHYR1_047198 [Brachionus plicatilis]|uniref:Uncharacterized protein n=1 Tax=Brachionus plicatilis TaxID=10195 RepID=A0A3M7P609_BRAPC|nr:hypothetical protein BpHYR1_047198 [Brachionus plicatilis]
MFSGPVHGPSQSSFFGFFSFTKIAVLYEFLSLPVLEMTKTDSGSLKPDRYIKSLFCLKMCGTSGAMCAVIELGMTAIKL